jgi:hypothetical protein
MKKALKITGIVLILGVALLQLVGAERTNPAVNESARLQASAQTPAEVDAILKRSCNDCHSNETVWPWYSGIAPMSWKVVEHVNEGREELNFSEWAGYDDKKKRKKLLEICEQVTEKEMPLDQYLWLHGEAVLTEADVKTLCDWVQAERGRLKTGEDE